MLLGIIRLDRTDPSSSPLEGSVFLGVAKTETKLSDEALVFCCFLGVCGSTAICLCVSVGLEELVVVVVYPILALLRRVRGVLGTPSTPPNMAVARLLGDKGAAFSPGFVYDGFNLTIVA